MARFLVISYDDDEMQWHHDFVEAVDELSAEVIVGKARHSHVICTSAYSVNELRSLVDRLETSTGVHKTAKELADAIGEELEEEEEEA